MARISYVLNGIFGPSSAVLAWMLYTEHRAKSPLISQIALALAVLGSIFSIVGSILILFDFTGFFLAGLYSALGNAFIGLWLVSFCYVLQRGDEFPHSLISFGFVVGAVMAFGLIGIPGFLVGIDDMTFLPWYLYLDDLVRAKSAHQTTCAATLSRPTQRVRDGWDSARLGVRSKL